jgi:hypothetical protein
MRDSSSRPVQGETGCKEVVAQPNVLRMEVVGEVNGEKIVAQRNIFEKSLGCATELSGVASASYAFRYPHRLRGHLCAVYTNKLLTRMAKNRGFKSPLIVDRDFKSISKEIEMKKNKKLYSFRVFKDELKRFKAIAVKKRTTASELLRGLMRAEIAQAEASIKPALQIAPEK